MTMRFGLGADPGDAAGDWSIRRPRRSRRLRFSLDARYATAGWPLAGCLRPSHLRGPGRQRVYAWGPGVTNPLTRHPVATASAIISLDEASEGRADLVAGSGYSSAYIIGRKAATLSTMRQATQLWRSIFQGQQTELGGLEIRLLPPRPQPPIYLAATGPRMLQLAGEIADGVLIMVGAAPGTVAWALAQIDLGMQRAGRQRHEGATHCGRHCVCGGRQRPRHRTDAPLCGRLIPPSACGDFVAGRRPGSAICPAAIPASLP